VAPPEKRPDFDYSDHGRVMNQLVARWPDTILWGTDTPYYTYIADRQQARGLTTQFRLKGSYEGEVLALRSLRTAQQHRVAESNTLAFLFG